MTRSATITKPRRNHWPVYVGVTVTAIALVAAILGARPGPGGATTAAAPVPGAAATAVHSAGALQAKESHFDFGDISMAAGNVSHRYWFRNESEAPVTIQRIHTSCMCTTATLVKGMRIIGSYGMAGHGPAREVNESLAPNEAAYVDVVFDPAAHGPAGLGRTERVVTIEPRNGAPLQVGFVALVRP
jgi:hypothetical protein